MIEITEYRNAKVVDEDGCIDVEINHPTYGWIPFTLNLADTGSDVDVKKLSNRIADGGGAAAYIPPTAEELTAENAIVQRSLRDHKLVTEVDPIVTNPLRWAELSTTKQNKWKTYRTNLLNVPQQSGFPDSISWPTKPS